MEFWKNLELSWVGLTIFVSNENGFSEFEVVNETMNNYETGSSSNGNFSWLLPTLKQSTFKARRADLSPLYYRFLR